jgi:hypothetical protein
MKAKLLQKFKTKIELNNDYAPLFGLIIAISGFPVYYIWQALRRSKTQ